MESEKYKGIANDDGTYLDRADVDRVNDIIKEISPNCITSGDTGWIIIRHLWPFCKKDWVTTGHFILENEKYLKSLTVLDELWGIQCSKSNKLYFLLPIAEGEKYSKYERTIETPYGNATLACEYPPENIMKFCQVFSAIDTGKQPHNLFYSVYVYWHRVCFSKAYMNREQKNVQNNEETEKLAKVKPLVLSLSLPEEISSNDEEITKYCKHIEYAIHMKDIKSIYLPFEYYLPNPSLERETDEMPKIGTDNSNNQVLKYDPNLVDLFLIAEYEGRGKSKFLYYYSVLEGLLEWGLARSGLEKIEPNVNEEEMAQALVSYYKQQFYSRNLDLNLLKLLIENIFTNEEMEMALNPVIEKFTVPTSFQGGLTVKSLVVKGNKTLCRNIAERIYTIRCGLVHFGAKGIIASRNNEIYLHPWIWLVKLVAARSIEKHAKSQK